MVSRGIRLASDLNNVESPTWTNQQLNMWNLACIVSHQFNRPNNSHNQWIFIILVSNLNVFWFVWITLEKVETQSESPCSAASPMPMWLSVSEWKSQIFCVHKDVQDSIWKRSYNWKQDVQLLLGWPTHGAKSIILLEVTVVEWN
jgi:hypothetical protein